MPQESKKEIPDAQLKHVTANNTAKENETKALRGRCPMCGKDMFDNAFICVNNFTYSCSMCREHGEYFLENGRYRPITELPAGEKHRLTAPITGQPVF